MTTTNPDYQEYLRLFPAIQEYQDLANRYNIAYIFQDNGGKYVQLLILLALKTDGRREGNDAFDENGVEFEIKTVNVELTRSFSTHHVPLYVRAAVKALRGYADATGQVVDAEEKPGKKRIEK